MYSPPNKHGDTAWIQNDNWAKQPPPMSPRHTHRILQYRLRHTFRHITRSSDYFSITVTKLGDICSWVFLLQLSTCVWSSDPTGSDMTWHFLSNGGCLINRSCSLDSLVNCSSIICPRRKGPEEGLGKLFGFSYRRWWHFNMNTADVATLLTILFIVVALWLCCNKIKICSVLWRIYAESFSTQ